MRQGLDRGVIVGIVLLALMVVVIGTSSYVNTRALRDNADRIAHSRKVIDAIKAVQFDTVHLQAALRVYLVTGFPEWIPPYEASAARLRADAGRLATLTADDAGHSPHSQRLGREIEAGIGGFDGVLKVRGGPNGHAAVVAFSRERGPRSFVDPLLETLAEMDRLERERLAAREAESEKAFDRAIFYGIAAAALGLVAVAMFVWMLARSIRASARGAEGLADQRELLSATLTSIGDAVIATDPLGNVTFMNAVAERLTGWSQADAAGVPLDLVFHIVNEFSRAPVENPALRALKDSSIVGLANHTVLVARDGSERPIDDSAAPITTRGTVRGAVLVFRDISERHEATKKLETSEERRRLALNAAELGAWHLDPTTGILTTDERFRAVFGVSADRLEYDDAVGLIHPDDRDRVQEAVTAATRPVDPAPYAIEYRVVHPDGSVHWVFAKGLPNYDRAGAGRKMVSFDGTVADVTDRKRAEAEMKRLLRQVEIDRVRLAEVFRNAPSFMCVLGGPDHVFERANDRYVELVGGRELIGRPVRDALPEVAGQGFIELLDRVYRTGEPFVGSGVRVLLGSGLERPDEERFLDFVYQPLRDADGGVTGILVQGVDLTDRVRDEAERARLAETLALALGAADLGTWDWDPVSDRITLSDRAAAIYDLPAGRTYTREWMRGLIHPDHRDRARDAAARSVAMRSEYNVEYPLVRPVWVSARGRGVYAPDGKLTRMLGVVQDVTERKRAEADLRASEERYRVLVNATSDVVHRMSADWSVMDPLDGRALVPSTAEPKRDWMQTNLPQFEHARVRAAIDRAVAGKQTFELEHQVNRAGGTLGWTFSRAVPILDAAGTIVDWFGTARDVTEQKLAQEELARVTADSDRRTRLYETILSATPDFVYVFSLDHRVIYANDSLIAMWGRGTEGAIGKTFLEIGYEPWHAEMHDREIDTVRATRQPIRGEVPFDGTLGRRIYDYIFVPVFGPDGEVEAVAGTTRDVTERQQAEETLRKLAADLSEADRRKDEFLATLAHELRNPLAPVRNGVQILRTAAPPEPRVERTLGMMDRQLNHMVHLVDDLMDVSRVSRGQVALRKERVDLRAVADSALESARHAVETAGHELEVRLPEEPLVFDADKTRLAQVLANLLNNAAKYTTTGGRITLSAERVGSDAVIRVTDTGIGIPAEMLQKVFEMFTQVGSSLDRAQGGLGIGLTLVKRLVELHGGTVTAHSDGPGLGSTFTVTLPAVDDHPPQSASDDDRTARASGRRILVVDDNRDGAESLAEMLRLLGNEVETAHDGFEAVERAEKYRPEVILMDLGMPKLNGLEATRRIRGHGWGRAMTIIAQTGWGQPNDRDLARAAGCDGHLVKPVNLPELEQLLARLRDETPN